MDIPNEINIGNNIVSIDKYSPKNIYNYGSYTNYYDIIRIQGGDEIPEDDMAVYFFNGIIEYIIGKNGLEISNADATVLSENLFKILSENKLNF